VKPGRWRDAVRTVAGTALDIVRPGLGRRLGESGAGQANPRLKRLVLHARLSRARRRGDEAAIQAALHAYWQGDAPGDYYDRYANRFQLWFLGPHQAIVEALASEAARRPYGRIVELGCGDGRVLAHLAGRLPRVPELLGLDINEAIIARTSAALADPPRLTFRAGNARAMFAEVCGDNTLLMTYGGVMEYFTADDLSRFFRHHAGRKNTAVALVEPVDPSHDLTADPGSHVFGAENSFSHNHGSLLERAGFAVRFFQEMNLGGVRWVLLLATRD
jgi:SAM-dependent methyltransferase